MTGSDRAPRLYRKHVDDLAGMARDAGEADLVQLLRSAADLADRLWPPRATDMSSPVWTPIAFHSSWRARPLVFGWPRWSAKDDGGCCSASLA